MFFLRMIRRSFTRQLRRRLLIALTVCLSATVSVSMLGVVFDVGDKLNAELLRERRADHALIGVILRPAAVELPP